MKTKILANVLQMLEPGLDPRAKVLTEYANYYFTGKQVRVYNGKFGVSFPLRTEFIGGIGGSVLRSVVNSLTSPEIELLEKGNKLLIKSTTKRASTRLTMVAHPLKGFNDRVVWPSTRTDGIDINTTLIRALGMNLVATGLDSSIPEQLYVAFVQIGKEILLGTSDSVCMVANKVRAHGPSVNRKVMVLQEFCRYLCAIAVDGDGKARWDGKLSFTDDVVTATLSNGLMIWTKPQVLADDTLVYEKWWTNMASPERRKQVYEITDELKLALGRARVVSKSSLQAHATRVSLLEDGWLRFKTTAEIASVRDEVGPTKQPKLKRDLWVDSVEVSKMLDLATGIAFFDNVVLMTLPKDGVFMVSLKDK